MYVWSWKFKCLASIRLWHVLLSTEELSSYVYSKEPFSQNLLKTAQLEHLLLSPHYKHYSYIFKIKATDVTFL